MNTNYYEKQKERFIVRKLELLQQRGCRCEKCGYNKNIGALEFHHKDPSTKKFQLDARHIANRSKEQILEEFDKCLVLCSNCHREEHYKQLNLDDVLLLNENYLTKKKTVSNKQAICKFCGKSFNYSKGKVFCSKECKDKYMGKDKYPSYEELMIKYNEFKNWNNVAKYFGITRKITQIIRKKHYNI